MPRRTHKPETPDQKRKKRKYRRKPATERNPRKHGN